MRLAHLRLVHYGPFEQLDLPLDPGRGRINLVIAPNGYGKSVIRRAIGEFLFGIKANTPMTFRFGTEKIRLHADITQDATTKSLIRRKGNGITLQTADGAKIGPDDARHLLGGADETTFRDLFGLDTALLRSGGQDLIRSQGRLGQVLFAAGGGMARVRDLLAELERKRDELGRANLRRRERPIWSALTNWEQGKADLRKAAMRPENWTTLERQAAETEQRLKSLLVDQAQDIQDRDRLRTISACRPWLDRLHHANATLQAAQDTPELDPDFEKRWRDALQQGVVTAGNATAAAAELEAAQTARTGLTFDPAWIKAEPDIATLIVLRGRAEGAETDLPSVQRELDAEQAKATALRHDLGWDASITLPPASAVKDAQRRLRLHPKLVADAMTAQDMAAAAERATVASRTQLDHLPPPGDLAALIDLTTLIKANGDPASRLDNARRIQRDAEAGLQAALAAIPDHPLPEHALATTAAPSEATLEAAATALTQAETDHATAGRTLADQQAEIERQQTRLTTLERSAMLPPPDALARARSHRDILWTRIYTPTPATPDPATAVALDRAIRDADAIADALIAHGQEVAEATALRNRLAELETARATQEATVAQTAAALSHARDALAAIARQAGGDAATVTALRAFLKARDNAVSARIARDSASAEHCDLDTQLRAMANSLAIALARPPRDVSELAAMLAEADRRIEADREIAAQRKSLTDQLTRQQADHAKAAAEAQKAARALHAWETEWQPAAAALRRPEQEPPALTGEVVTQIEDLRKAETTIAEKQRRIDEMHAAIASLATRITSLTPLAPDLATLPPIEAAAAFQQRAEAERTAAARCRDADHRIEHAQATHAAATNRAETAARTLDGLRTALRAETNEAAEHQLQRVRAVIAARSDATEAMRQLAVQGNGLGIDDLLARAAESTPEADAALIAEIDARQQTRANLIDTARTEANAAESTLAQAGNGIDAAEAAQRREAAQALLGRHAEEALILHATHSLLQAALDQQASHADQPLLRRIGDVFRTITGGAQAGVRVEDTNTGQTMVALDANGETRKTLDELSEGTCDQLYLALRIAALEDYAATTSPLPFVADDILQTFDDTRTLAAMQALQALSEQVQVIILTHHPHVAALAAQLPDDAVNVLHLAA